VVVGLAGRLWAGERRMNDSPQNFDHRVPWLGRMLRVFGLAWGDGDSLLLSGATSALVVRVAGFVAVFGVSIFLGRVLGPTQYGIYSYSLALLNLLLIPSAFGFPELLVRQVSVYRKENEWGLLRGLVRTANLSSFAISMGVVFSVFASGALFSLFDSQRYLNFSVAVLILPFLALEKIRSATLRGLQKIVQSQLPIIFFLPSIFLVLFLVGTRLNFSLDANFAIIVRFLAVSATFLLSSLFVVRVLRKLPQPENLEFRRQEWYRSASSFVFLGGLLTIQNQIDILILGVFQPSASVGVYKVVIVASSFAVFVFNAVNTAAAPIVARIVSTGDRDLLQEVTSGITRLVFLGGLPVCLLLIVFGGRLLGFFYGEAYVVGASALQILCMGQMVNTAFGSVVLMLNMGGYERDTLRAYLATCTMNVLLNLVLIPRFGIEGAAAATATTVLVTKVVLSTLVWRRLGVRTSILRAFGRKAPR
jgi:O-antigen/teichoic acid export membrane protein